MENIKTYIVGRSQQFFIESVEVEKKLKSLIKNWIRQVKKILKYVERRYLVIYTKEIG